MQPVKFANRMDLLGTESAFEVLAKSQKLEAEGKSIVHLEIGQPNFNTPAHIIEAAYDAMKAGFTGYTDSQGILETRQAIADYIAAYKNVPTDPSEIVVVPGAKPILFFTMLALVEPGDEVICPDPGYPIYSSCVRFCGGTPVSLPILHENDFKVDPDDLKKLITKKTKLVILNNPANPTGGMMSKDDILKIADIIRDTDAFILSDEIYDRLVYDGSKPFSIASIEDMKDRVILLDGFSKTYAMTGWRLGYGVMNRTLAERMTLLNINSCACATAFIQKAGIAALQGSQADADAMKAEFFERITYMVGALNAIDGIECRMPRGAFYVFPRIRDLGLSSSEFAERLLYDAGISCLSGSSFGTYGEGHIRFSVANSLENIKEAVRRLEAFTTSLKK